MINFYVQIKKSKSGSLYPVLCCDVGDVERYVSFDKMLICELLDISPKALSSLDEGDITPIN